MRAEEEEDPLFQLLCPYSEEISMGCPQETSPLISLACSPITEPTAGKGGDGGWDSRRTDQPGFLSHAWESAAPEDLRVILSKTGVQEG